MQLNFFNRPHFENGSINKITDVLKEEITSQWVI